MEKAHRNKKFTSQKNADIFHIFDEMKVSRISESDISSLIEGLLKITLTVPLNRY